CPASNQRLPCAAGCSRAQDPSGASPARSSARQTPGATDNTSPRSPRSGGLRPPCSGPAKPEHRLAAASQRSLQACIASLPLQSSWMSKTYLKSDHFNGGGSPPDHKFKVCSSGQKRRITPQIKREFKPRAAIDPVIGHHKEPPRMGRNHLAHASGDAINAVLAAPQPSIVEVALDGARAGTLHLVEETVPSSQQIGSGAACDV